MPSAQVRHDRQVQPILMRDIQHPVVGGDQQQGAGRQPAGQPGELHGRRVAAPAAIRGMRQPYR